jgi:flagellar biosynthesis GTPase FlhF
MAEAKRKAEEEQKRKQEEERKRQLAEEAKRKEEERKREEAEQRRIAEAKRKEEEERKRQEELAALRQKQESAPLGTVIDSTTGLMWQKRPQGKGRNWRDARNYCENLKLAGFSDWELPDRRVLKDMVNKKNSLILSSVTKVTGRPRTHL